MGNRDPLRERFRGLPRRLPLLGLVTGCFAGILLAESGLPAWLAVVPFLGSLLAWRASRSQVLLGALACTLLWLVHGVRLGSQEQLMEHLKQGRAGVVDLSGTVTRYDDRAGPLPEAWLRIDQGSWRGAQVGLLALEEPLRPGDRIRVRGALVLPPEARNPGEWDRRRWMRRAGLSAIMEDVSLEAREGVDPRYLPRRWAGSWRGEVRTAVTRGLDPEGREAALLQALVLGDRSGGGKETFGVFRGSGTMHVFAVSGLHVGLVALLGWLLVRALRMPRSWGLGFVLALVWAYALVTGLRPPAFRAALMATFILAGFALRRRPSLANSLLASVPVVLLFDSFQWRLPGFQLSYLVVASISLFGSVFMNPLRPWVDGDSFLPRALLSRRQEGARWLREKTGGLAAVSASAWIGSLPLMAAYFGVVTPVAILASMVLVPLVFVVLAVALTALVTGMASEGLAEQLNRANGLLVDRGYAIADGFARIPGAQFELARGRWGEDGLVVFALRGGGASSFLDAGGGVLLDAGNERDHYEVIGPALRGGFRSPDSLLLTHPDGAHVGGALPLLREGRVRQCLLPTAWARSPAYRNLLEEAPGHGCRLLRAQVGRRYPVGDGIWLEVLHVPDGNEDRLADDRGLVALLHWQGWRILFTGDAGFPIERAILEAGVDPRADVWVMGRHAIDHAGTAELVRAVGPRVILLEDAEALGTPALSPAWIAAREAEGIVVWRRSVTGAVAISVSGDGLTLDPFLDRGQSRTLTRD